MPTYYSQALGLDLLKSGIFSVLPWIAMVIFANIGGWIADSLVPKLGVTKVRKIMQTVKRMPYVLLKFFPDWFFGTGHFLDAVIESAFRSWSCDVYGACTRIGCV